VKPLGAVLGFLVGPQLDLERHRRPSGSHGTVSQRCGGSTDPREQRSHAQNVYQADTPSRRSSGVSGPSQPSHLARSCPLTCAACRSRILSLSPCAIVVPGVFNRVSPLSDIASLLLREAYRPVLPPPVSPEQCPKLLLCGFPVLDNRVGINVKYL